MMNIRELFTNSRTDIQGFRQAKKQQLDEFLELVRLNQEGNIEVLFNALLKAKAEFGEYIAQGQTRKASKKATRTKIISQMINKKSLYHRTEFFMSVLPTYCFLRDMGGGKEDSRIYQALQYYQHCFLDKEGLGSLDLRNTPVSELKDLAHIFNQANNLNFN